MKTATLHITTTKGEFALLLSERAVRKGRSYFIEIETLVNITVAMLRAEFKQSGTEVIDIVRVDGAEMGGAL